MSDTSSLVCSECGETEDLRWIEARNQELITRQLCFTCCFWAEMVDLAVARPSDVARIGGRHYVIEPDLPPQRPSHCAGMGGRQFAIVFCDGRTVVTRNLWFQGVVPERWRDRLPDNAAWKTVA